MKSMLGVAVLIGTSVFAASQTATSVKPTKERTWSGTMEMQEVKIPTTK